MKQYFSVALAVLFCALMPAACTTQTTAVKFMSYNIRNGRGADDVQDLGRIAEVIGRVAPDVVALQEVDSVTGRMNGRFIPEELGRMTGMHARFCRAIDYDGGGYGIGLLSRAEPLSVRRIPLPGREEARVLLMAEFPGYVVCVTHLSLTPEDQRASLPIIRQATDTCRKPVLLRATSTWTTPGRYSAGWAANSGRCRTPRSLRSPRTVLRYASTTYWAAACRSRRKSPNARWITPPSLRTTARCGCRSSGRLRSRGPIYHFTRPFVSTYFAASRH